MFNRKGQGLSVETMVIVLIALLILVVIILIFTGQANTFFDSVQEFISGVNTPTVDYKDVS